MSWQALAAVEGLTAVNATEKYVLWMLAYHHNLETGQCSPSLRFLQKQTNLSRRLIVRAIDSLESKELIHVLRTKEPNSKEHAVNNYSLLFLTGGSPGEPGGSLYGVEVSQSTNKTGQNKRTGTSSRNTPDSDLETTSLGESENLSDGRVLDRSTGEILSPKPKRKPPESPELVEVLAHWESLELGYVSQSARTKLRAIVGKYGAELTKKALTDAFEKQAKWPVSWASAVIGGLKRASTAPKGAPQRTTGRYEHLVVR